MERPYEQIRRMVKLFEYNRLKLRFRNEMNGPGLLIAGQNTSVKRTMPNGILQ